MDKSEIQEILETIETCLVLMVKAGGLVKVKIEKIEVELTLFSSNDNESEDHDE